MKSKQPKCYGCQVEMDHVTYNDEEFWECPSCNELINATAVSDSDDDSDWDDVDPYLNNEKFDDKYI